MLHQIDIVFYLCQPLVFLRSQDAKKIQKGVSYNLNLMVERDKLIFMQSYQNPLCRLYLNPYHIRRISPEKISIYYLDYQKSQKGQKIQNQIPIALVTSSKMCIQQILQSCPQKKHKSCLSFVPSSVQHISILSGQSPQQKFRGFINLAGIMFLILNIRNIIDNFLYYGFRFKAQPMDFIPPMVVLAFLGLIAFVEVAFHLEKLRFNRIIQDKNAKIFMIINQCLLVVYNIMFCQQLEGHPIQSTFFTVFSVVLLLKLISFKQVNSQLINMLKRLYSSKQSQFKQYLFANHQISQSNLLLIREAKSKWQSLICHSKLYYFILAPTLCYQLQYPRTSSIRYLWVLKRMIQFVFIASFQLILWVQYIEPGLDAWFTLMKHDYTMIGVVQSWLRLAIPNTIMWITGFYSFFHLFLNIVAELMRFADRKFYMDWWNCRSLEEYWKTWNLPVHFWFIRHMYNPLLKMGISKNQAMMYVFLVSAIAHEFLVCVPLQLISYYAFLAMILQAPTIYFEKKLNKLLRLKNSELGNVSFWFFFCICGQPIVVFIYYSLYKLNESAKLEIVV